MRKITSLLMLFCMCVGMAWGQDVYRPGSRTATLEVGKQYFIGAATFYNNARYNLLYNNGGTLAYSDKVPSSLITDASYLFTVEKFDQEGRVYIKNNEGKYLQAGDLASTQTDHGIHVVPYSSVKGGIACGSDVQACDEKGNKIEYNNITDETPIVCVYSNESKGWRHINGLQIGKSTPFAFYEVEDPYQLPEITTDMANPKLYTIKNARANKYATYNGTTQSMSLKSSVSNLDGLFYFTAGAQNGTYKIHNLATSNKCESYNKWTTDGIDWYIQKSGNTTYDGVAISMKSDLADGNAWNDYQGSGTSVNFWNGNDDGSVWTINEFEESAAVFDLKMSTESEKHFYFIKNLRSNKYASFVQVESQFTQTANTNYGSYWYFVEEKNAQDVPAGYKACYIYNAGCDLPVENPSNGYMAAVGASPYPAKLYYVRTYEYDNKWGYVMYSPIDNNGWCDYNGEGQLITNYDYKDAGSIWSLIPANKTEAQLKSDANTEKTNALTFIAHAEEADFYTYTDEAIATAKTAVEGIDVSTLHTAVSSLLNTTANTAVTALKATDRTTAVPAVGQYIQLKNKQYGKYLKATDTGLNSVTDKNDLATLWLVVEGTDGNVKLQNASTEKYIGQIRQSANVAMVEAADAKQFAFTNQVDCYAVFKETSGDDYAYGHIAGHNVLVGWECNADATQWVISEYSLNESLADLQEIYDVVDNAFGDQPGQYKHSMQDIDNNLYMTFVGVKDILSPEAVVDVPTAKTTAADLKAKWDVVKNTVREINAPAQGKFYRLKNVVSGNYMCGNATNVNLKKDGSSLHTTIFYLGENNTLVSYNSGRYLDCSAKGYSAVGEAKSGEFAMAYGGAQANVITYKNNGYSTYGAGADGSDLDRGSDTPNKAGYNWKLEEVTWLPIPVNVEAGWTSIYSPVELELSYNRFKAYTVSAVSETSATLVEQTVVPAGVGVVLEYQDGAEVENGCVFLKIKATETEAVSELLGTYADEYILADAYVLGMVDSEVGFYTATKNQQDGASWLNNGFKAYLPKTVGSNVQALRFNFGGETTAIDAVEVENTNAPIYDLSGRRVLSTVKGGIYIQNGKKFIVK